MKPDIASELRFLHTPLAFDAAVRGTRQNIVMTFGIRKRLEPLLSSKQTE